MKKKKTKLLPITKPGTQKRRFTHIEDIINGLLVVAKKSLGDNFSIGSDKSYTIIQLAKMLRMKYKLTPYKKGNRITGALKTLKKKQLGWSAQKNLKDYLRQFD